MYLVLAAAVGFAIGMAAHDLAIQSLRDKPLRPFIGVCRECGMDRGWVSLRCSNCGREVGREGLLALVTAAVGAGMAHAVGPSWSLIPYAGFLLLTAALGITDIEAMRIVDRLNLRGSVLIILLLGITSVAECGSRHCRIDPLSTSQHDWPH